MKNVIPAIISIIIGIAVSYFTLDYIFDTNTKSVSQTTTTYPENESTTNLEENTTSEDDSVIEETSSDSENITDETLDENAIGTDTNEDDTNEISTESIENSDANENEISYDTEASPEEDETVVETESNNSDETIDINFEDINGDYDKWSAYTKKNIDLMSTYQPIDNKGAKTEKGMFLTLLRTGAYLPVKKEKEGKIMYELTNIDGSVDEKIKKSIIGKATFAHNYYKIEGKKLPTYDFVDLDGKTYNKEDTKGKILVLKCWFINCKVCVEEFPQLNALVDKYKDDNIEFISLAFDEGDKLKKFLETKPFKYATIPNQKKYMSKKLKVKQYPTHLIIDSDGRIVKMVNNVKTLASELELFLGK